ncbi:MAG: TetR/AcrR family transcriptional regulator [Deinococcales bacterium]
MTLKKDSVKDLPQPVTQRGEMTRRKLLEAAENEFGAKGFHNTSIADITKRADVGQGTFYLYFPSKEDILRELVRYMSRSLRLYLSEKVAGIRDRLERERLGLRAFVDFCFEHKNLYRIVMQAQFVDEAIYQDYYRTIAEGYISGLRSAQAEGQIRQGDAEAQAWVLMGIAHFLGLRYAIWQEQAPPESVLQEVATFMASGLRPLAHEREKDGG